MKKTQQERILTFLQRRNLTPHSALVKLGVTNLRARVCELRQQGYLIETNSRIVQSGVDAGKRVTSYSLLSR